MKLFSLYFCYAVLLLSLASNPAFASESDVGIITLTEGTSEIFHKNQPPQKDWTLVQYEGSRYFSKKARAGDRVPIGAIIHTGANGKTRFIYDNGDQINIGPASSVLIEKRATSGPKKTTLLNLMYGKMRIMVKKGSQDKDKAQHQDKAQAKGQSKDQTQEQTKETMAQDSDFKVKTSSVVAGVRGTDFTVSHSPATARSEVSVLRGAVAMKPQGSVQSREVQGGFSAAVQITPKPVDPKVSVPQSAPLMEIKRTTKEDLASIYRFSHVQQKAEDLKILPPPVAEEIRKAEQRATTAVLEDIKATDPKLYVRLVNDGETSATNLNAAVIGQQMQTAPVERPVEKKLLRELEELDEDIYQKYFKAE